MKNDPKISVLMSVYNGETFLREAIDSILNQTFSDFEFIIINDYSTDSSLDIINSYADERIVLINNPENYGLAKSLNIGILKAKGEYIARMDADDISLPLRLFEQVRHMDTHTDIGVCGTWAKTIGESQYSWKNPTRQEEVRALMLFTCCMLHPTVMIRKSVLLEHHLLYNERYISAQDYELWSRMMDVTAFSNIPIPLLYYRINDKGITKTKNDIQKNNSLKIVTRLLKKLDIEATEEELLLHNSMAPQNNVSLQEFIQKKELWLKKLLQANKDKKYFDTNGFEMIISTVWISICTYNIDKGFGIIKECLKSSLFLPTLKNFAKIFIMYIKLFKQSHAK